jgi:amino acid permease
VEERYKLNQHPRQNTIRAVYRIVLMFLLTLIAMMIPYFADCMALLGAVSSTFLMFILPVVFEWKLMGGWRQVFQSRPKQQIYMGCLVLALGIFIGIVGGGQAVWALWHDIQTGEQGRGGH